jgi:DNA helicase-2/ATP-dependent DNA helicase PcrA
VTANSKEILTGLKHLPKEYRRDIQLATSFSDLRYYLECPHDFYLRKVLGFAPTIDQAFGYGRGVHNLLRAIHSNPKKWAELSRDRASLEAEIQKLIDRGLFYLRYTTGDPADNMRGKGRKVVADYVARYASELARVEFDPERAFETLIEYGDGEGGALISGAIDIVRQDDPPRVTLIDFKSGDTEADAKKLDEEEMRLQVAIYALAAKKELQYQPEQGLVRYLDVGEGEKDAIEVPLKEEALAAAKSQVAETARSIRDRKFSFGPKKAGADGRVRCGVCDFLCMCGMKQARAHRATPGAHW